MAAEPTQETNIPQRSDPRWQAEVRMAAMTAAAAFRARGWTYATGWGEDDEPIVPGVDRLESTLWRLITNIATNDEMVEGWSSSSGRLYVQVGDDGDLHLSMDLGTLDEFIAPASTEDA